MRVPEAEVVTPKKQKQVIVRVICPRCVGKSEQRLAINACNANLQLYLKAFNSSSFCSFHYIWETPGCIIGHAWKNRKKCYSLQIYPNTQLDHYNDSVAVFEIMFSLQALSVTASKIIMYCWNVLQLTLKTFLNSLAFSLFQNIHCFSGLSLNAVEHFLY